MRHIKNGLDIYLNELVALSVVSPSSSSVLFLPLSQGGKVPRNDNLALVNVCATSCSNWNFKVYRLRHSIASQLLGRQTTLEVKIQMLRSCK